MSKVENFEIQENDVLIGSGHLKNKDEAKYNRLEHMLQNMQSNQAYTFFIEQFPSIDKNTALADFKKKFKKYREDWNDQPREAIRNKLSGKDLENKKKPPLCIDIEVASICDLACPFCFREFVATPDKIIDEKLCYDLIDQAAELKVPSMKFNWRGEPLLHPKLSKFIQYAKYKGILDTIINTNATNLNETKAKELIDAGLDHIIYSFDGGSKETYEKNRPGRFKTNTFEKVYENIKTLSRVKSELNSPFPFTKIQMLLTEETFNEKDNFYKLFNDYVDDVSVNQYTERGGKLSDLDKEAQEVYNTIVEKNNLGKNTPYMRDPKGKIYVSKQRKACEQPFQRLLFTYEGRAAMCCYDWGATHPVGYVSEKAFNNKSDYTDVMEKTKNNKKGFELLSNIEMPKELNNPKEVTSSIKEIWYGAEINEVRDKQVNNCSNDLAICKDCTFKDTYDWID